MTDQVTKIEKVLPELESFKEVQLKLVEENPFLPIETNKDYTEARKRRTDLRSGRVNLQNQEKAIASQIMAFRKMIGEKTAGLIAITQPAEEKQQQEIDRWEAIKAKEKEEREEAERLRVLRIKDVIATFYEAWDTLIITLTEDEIDGKMAEFKESVSVMDDLQEFQDLFNAKVETLESKFRAWKDYLRLEAEKKAAKERQDKIEAENQKILKELAERKKQEADRLAAEEAEKKKAEELKSMKSFDVMELTDEEEEALGGARPMLSEPIVGTVTKGRVDESGEKTVESVRPNVLANVNDYLDRSSKAKALDYLQWVKLPTIEELEGQAAVVMDEFFAEFNALKGRMIERLTKPEEDGQTK